jgi:hypothetical protein
MQVRPRGQKKPGQHGLQFRALSRILDALEDTSFTVEQAQPGWHPGAQEFWLQLGLTLALVRLLAKVLTYNSTSDWEHSIKGICPVQTNSCVNKR